MKLLKYSFLLVLLPNLYGSENELQDLYEYEKKLQDLDKYEKTLPKTMQNAMAQIDLDDSDDEIVRHIEKHLPKAASLPNVHGSKTVDREKILREVREQAQRYIPEIVTPGDVEDKVHAYELEHLINKNKLFGGEEFFNTVLQEIRNILINAKMPEWIAKAYHRPLPLQPVSIDTNPSPLHTKQYGDFFIPITEDVIPNLMEHFGKEQRIPLKMQNGFLRIDPAYNLLMWNYQSRLQAQVKANDDALCLTIPDDIKQRIDKFCDDELAKLPRWISWSDLQNVYFAKLNKFLQGIEDETATKMHNAMRFERVYQYAKPRAWKKIHGAGITVMQR